MNKILESLEIEQGSKLRAFSLVHTNDISEAAHQFVLKVAAHCSLLEFADCGGTRHGHFKNCAIALATQCPLLSHLNLSFCSLDDDGLSSVLTHCLNLTCLDISYCEKVTSVAFAYPQKINCVLLKTLNCDGCPLIRYMGFSALVYECKKLEHVTLSGHHGADSSESLVGLLESDIYQYTNSIRTVTLRLSYTESRYGPQLEPIRWFKICGPTIEPYQLLTKFEFMPHYCVGSNELRVLAMRAPNLTHVKLCGCPNILDEGVVELAQHCPQVQSVDLTGCAKLTAVSVKALGACCCTTLRELFMADCVLVPAAAFGELAQQCAALEALSVTRNPGDAVESSAAVFEVIRRKVPAIVLKVCVS